MRPAVGRGVRTLASLILIIGNTAFMSGCETLERAIKGNPKTAVGSGPGGAGGALNGGGASGGSAIIGGLTGVLTGGLIGNLVDRQERTRAATAETMAYTEERGNVVRIEEVAVTPQAMRPGETVNIDVQYAILTQRGTEPSRIREIRQIYFQGDLVGNPMLEIERANGTYWSTLPITLPETATPGRYEVVVGVEMHGALDRWQSKFTLLQP